MIGAGALILLAGAWVAVTALMARGQLNQVRADLRVLRAQIDAHDFTAASATARDLQRHAHSAHELTTGPAWAMLAALPAGGEPLKTVRGVTAGADELGSSALGPLIAARSDLNPSGLRAADGSIDLARIEGVAPALATADRTITEVLARIRSLPSHTWVSGVDHGRTDVLTNLAGIASTVHSADLAAQILPDMLGGHGVRRYFVGFQNNAEARGTGGLPGAFAIVAVDNGKLHIERFENDGTLNTVPTGLDLGPDFDQLYGNAESTSLYVNSNISPNFPYAAQIWTAMWERYSGQHLDGAVGVDPTALSYFLAVTGPATMPGGVQVTAGNVVQLTQSTVYATLPDRTKRREFLKAVAAAVSDRVLDSRASLSNLVQAAGQASTERRLLVWSADPAIEALIAQTSVAGLVRQTAAPYVGLAITNDGGDKLDYYLDRTITWQSSGCGSNRDVTVTIALTNNAPTGLPFTVTDRSDVRDYPIQPGDNRLEVAYLATDGAAMDSVTVDGTATSASIGAELGHPVYTVDLELPRATTRTIVLHLVEPGSAAAPVVLRQPLVRPLTVTLEPAHCG